MVLLKMLTFLTSQPVPKSAKAFPAMVLLWINQEDVVLSPIP